MIPCHSSTSLSPNELLNLMGTQTVRVESDLGKPRTQGSLWEMRPVSQGREPESLRSSV